tara:strand:- start:589 stop:1518 length:930 start_codon:yes stop_codon:yes gene_type:complete
MKIAFHCNKLGLRGTYVATYDYALHNRNILGNESIILVNKDSDMSTLAKFESEFKVYKYNDFDIDVPTIVKKTECDAIYYLRSGEVDKTIDGITNLIHVVFHGNHKHGDKYVGISKWLGTRYNIPWVPHMVNLPNVPQAINYKKTFNIQDKFVVGWYGGNNFDLQFARDVVIDVANKRDDIVFLFMNHDPFCNLDNVLFINPIFDLNQKVAFINTFDILLHGRYRGETFGLTIAESSTCNKPVITYSESPERNHIDTLGDKGFYYKNYDELYSLLMYITKSDIENKDWNCYKEFTPENVMNKFKEVFLC